MELRTLPELHHKLTDNKFQVKNHLLILNTKKSSGLDGILELPFKKYSHEFTPVLAELTYGTESFPDGWKSVRVQPIPQKYPQNAVIQL